MAVVVVIGLLAYAVAHVHFGDQGKGTRSERLAVNVTPRTALAAGQEVRVQSSAFTGDHIIGVAVCLREADTQRKGLDACDTTSGSRYALGTGGHLDARFRVPRVITVGDRAYDCASTPERCVVVAADANDYDRSGGQPISFAPGQAPAALDVTAERPLSDRLPIAASVTGPLRAGSKVTLIARGFEPGEPILVAWCGDQAETVGMARSCQPEDASAAVKALLTRSISPDIVRHADAQGTVVAEVPTRASVDNYGADVLATVDQDDAPTTSESIDCRAKAGRCWFVVAAAADTKRSAILPYAVAPG